MNYKLKITHYFVRVCLWLIFPCCQLAAQPSAVQKAAKSVFTLTTYAQDGKEIATSEGVFVGADGEAVSSWKPFVGATRATVTDVTGKQSDVTEIVGASELYDVCKFRVAASATPARLSPTPLAAGSKAWQISYALKKPEIKEMTVKKVETFMEQYTFYIVSKPPSDSPEGEGLPPIASPLINASGQVVALAQPPTSPSGGGREGAESVLHAVDINYPNNFTITNGLSTADPILSQTRIRKALPDKKDDALLALIMTRQQADSLQYAQTIDNYISKFPNEIDGYAAKAMSYVEANDFAAADHEMQQALKKTTQKDQAHSEYAKLIYQKNIYKSELPYADWTFDKALAEAQAAYKLNPLPIYQHQQAQIIFAQGDYQQAYDMFIALASSPSGGGREEAEAMTPELYLEAAQCKANLQAPQEEILQLLDKAVEACPRPLTNIAAPYILARGQAYDNAGQYRKAISDYNTYDTLMVFRATPEFYYLKYQCEVKVRQYQQALGDIAHAAVLNPQEPTYLAELASLNLKVGRLPEAIRAADLCISVAPDYPDAYIVKGLALIRDGKKAEGLQALEQARNLNDQRAQPLIDKYQ